MVKKAIFRRTRRSATERAGRGKGERGAALVEFALVAPLFFAVVFGGIEIGLMFRSYLSLEDVTRASARVASVQRNADDADTAILNTIAARTNGLQGDVTKIIIFNAATLDDGLPAACISGDVAVSQSSPVACNAYDIADGDVAAAAAGAVENGWPAAERDPFENIGIYIEYEYQFATGFFDTLTLSSTTVEVIELDI